jgi:hypothetical protein
MLTPITVLVKLIPTTYVYGVSEELVMESLAALDPVAVKDFQAQIATYLGGLQWEWWFIVKERAFQRKREY